MATGFGIQTPFQRDGKQSFAASGGAAHWNSKIGQVLGTRVGELLWDTEFGSELDRLRHLDNNLDITPIARQYTVDALGRWLPELVVTEFAIERVRDTSGAETKLKVTLRYSVMSDSGAVSLDGQEFAGLV